MSYGIQELQTYSPTRMIETVWDVESPAQPLDYQDVEPNAPELESIQTHADWIRAWKTYGSLVEHNVGKPEFDFGYPPQTKAKASELALDDEVTEQERFLFEAVLKHRGQMGKGMWKAIEEEYRERFQSETTQSGLRHMLSGLSHHIQWPKFEVNRLLRAYVADEAERFVRLSSRLKEAGGGEVWNWSAKDVEAQMIKMGLEEPKTSKAQKRKRPNENVPVHRKTTMMSKHDNI